MSLLTEATVKDVEVVMTVACLAVAGLIVLCKVVACEFIDSLYDVRERRLERRKKIEERLKEGKT